MKLTSIVLSYGLLLTVAASGLAAEKSTDWKSLLTHQPRYKLPKPFAKVIWRDELQPALDLAKSTGKPLFVTFRCLPCKQCADFDKSVMEGGPKLDPLLTQFVTVRITNAEHLDRRLLPFEGYQDLDLSWWGYFLSSQGELYGIFGGRDAVSAKTRISVDALANTLRRVLAHHYDPKRKTWNVDGPVPDLSLPAKSNNKLPGFKSWAKGRTEKSECMHCHHVAEVLRQPALDAGKFDVKRDLQMWPLPENVGIHLDRDHGLKVTKVVPRSPAARAGIQQGDVLGAANGQLLYGQADFRGVLHRGPQAAGAITVQWLRDGEVHSGKLTVKDGWRKTPLDWRISVSQGNIGFSPGFFPLKARDARRKNLGIAAGRMAVEAYIGRRKHSPSRDAGLRHNDIITAVNGESPDMFGRAFLVWFRLQFKKGDKVTLTVRKSRGNDRKVTFVVR